MSSLPWWSQWWWRTSKPTFRLHFSWPPIHHFTSGCWRRLAGATPTCPIERRAASGGARVGGAAQRRYGFGVAAPISRVGRRCALRVESHAPAMASSSGRRPRIARTMAAWRTGRENVPCAGCSRRHRLGAGQGFWPEGEPCVIGVPSVWCCRVARAAAKTPIARRAEPTHARREAARGPLLHVNLVHTHHAHLGERPYQVPTR